MLISVLKGFLKQPITLVGIITALLFQVFFSVIWLTGYDHVTDRIGRLTIAIVNEEGSAAEPIVQGIRNALTFRSITDLSLDDAMDAMERREIRMVVDIPQGFLKQTAEPGGSASLNYWINQSNPQMVSNVMQTVAAQITGKINGSLNPALSDRIEANVQIVNPAANFAETMVPLMIVTASFTGSMLLAMNLNRASLNLSAVAGKWSRFAARFILMGAVALLASLISASLLSSLGIAFTAGFFITWMFEFLIILACMALAQFSLVLFGDAGAWINIALLSIQMLSSGATIPREILSPFYSRIGELFPASYAVDGMLDLVIGGHGIGHDVAALFCIAGISILVTILVTAVRRDSRKATGDAVEALSA